MLYNKPTCILRVSEVPLHLYQIIAGFMLINKEGLIDLKVEESKTLLPYNMMELEIDNQLKVLYDVNDGYDNLIEDGNSYIDFMDSLLDQYDICFKRSFSDKYNKSLINDYKIYPLGLNYMTTIKGNLAHKSYKCDPKNEKIKKFIRRLPFSQYYNNKYLIENFECKPKLNNDPNILFFARLWDPSGMELSKLPKDKVEERIEINKVRVECIKACKKEFGKFFNGGITPSSYSKENYGDLVINNKRITNRDGYLKLMKESDICIATTGLHDSIGWKFGEYVAASKAIVSEKLHYELPGDFKKNKNYLEFNNVEQCINNIYELFNNKNKRYEIMENNYIYYLNYVKPNKLVLNSLEICFNKLKTKGFSYEKINGIYTYV